MSVFVPIKHKDVNQRALETLDRDKLTLPLFPGFILSKAADLPAPTPYWTHRYNTQCYQSSHVTLGKKVNKCILKMSNHSSQLWFVWGMGENVILWLIDFPLSSIISFCDIVLWDCSKWFRANYNKKVTKSII